MTKKQVNNKTIKDQQIMIIPINLIMIMMTPSIIVIISLSFFPLLQVLEKLALPRFYSTCLPS